MHLANQKGVIGQRKKGKKEDLLQFKKDTYYLYASGLSEMRILVFLGGCPDNIQPKLEKTHQFQPKDRSSLNKILAKEQNKVAFGCPAFRLSILSSYYRIHTVPLRLLSGSHSICICVLRMHGPVRL